MAWNELFTTAFGLLSLLTIIFVVGMLVYLIRFALRKMDEDAATAGVEPTSAVTPSPATEPENGEATEPQKRKPIVIKGQI